MKITSVHGSGGQATSDLIADLFVRRFANPVLARLDDSAVVPGASRLALTTDSFVVNPLFFPGGDIGKLAVCGTVNDLLMSGATPRYLTCGFILQEGADTEDLDRIAASMAEAAGEAGVEIVAGDTKVVEGRGDIYINTAGVGLAPSETLISASRCSEGDAVLVSGYLGEHHAAIMSARMGIANTIESDCAPLGEMVGALLQHGVAVKAMRDVTRGGLATVLNEFARASGCCVELQETAIPVSSQVKAFCGILGLDPLYMGNEGKLAVVVDGADAERALSLLQGSRYGQHAAVVGRISRRKDGVVLLTTGIGGTRLLPVMYNEGLPRIC